MEKLPFTALFNNMWTLKYAFFAAVNQMFGGSSQITTTAEHRSVVWTVHSELITARSAVIGSREEPRNIWLTVAKNPFIGWALNLRVRMLLKGAVMNQSFQHYSLILVYSLWGYQYKAVDETRNMDHPWTSRNINNYAKKYVKLNIHPQFSRSPL